MDLAKTDCYSIRGDPRKLAGLVEGYGDLPGDWRERTELYRLFHAVELWDWFASIGTTQHLPALAADIAAIAGRRSGG
jgi:hygromycin-B 7''-O-kinase